MTYLLVGLIQSRCSNLCVFAPTQVNISEFNVDRIDYIYVWRGTIYINV